MADRLNLSLCLITKNDEKYISDCIQGLKDVVDEVVIADIGSTDETVKIAKFAGANVYEIEWEGSYSAAKNLCLEHAKGRWVLFLEAYEYISAENLKKIKPLLNNPNAEGYLLYIDYNPEEHAISSPVQSLRLLRNRKEYRFQYKSFEMIPNELIVSIQNTSIGISHRGGQALPWQISSRIMLLREDIIERPEDSYVQYVYGIELLNQQKFEESILYFQKSRENVNFGYLFAPHLYKCLSWSLLYLKRYDDAAEVLNEGINNFLFYTDLLVLRGELHRQLKQYREAIQDLSNCIKSRQQPNLMVPAPEIDICTIFETLGEIHEQIFNYRQALACYRQAYESNRANNELLEKICSLAKEVESDSKQTEFGDSQTINELECIIWSRDFMVELEEWLYKLKGEATGDDVISVPAYQKLKKPKALLNFYHSLIDVSGNEPSNSDIELTCAELHEKIGAFYEKERKINEALSAYLRVLQWEPLNERAQEKIKSFYNENSSQINNFLEQKERILEGSFFHHKQDFSNYVHGIVSFKNWQFKQASSFFSQIEDDEMSYPIALAYIVSCLRLDNMEKEAESLINKNKKTAELLLYIFNINKSYALCKLDEEFRKYPYSEQIQREKQRIRIQAFNAKI